MPQNSTAAQPVDLRARLRRPVLSTEMPRLVRPANTDIAPHDHTLLSALALVVADLVAVTFGAGLLLTLALVWPQNVSWLGAIITSAALLPLLIFNALAGLYPGFGLMLAERLRRRWIRGFAYLLWLSVFFTVQGLGALAALVAVGGLVALASAPLFEDIARLVLYRKRRWGRPALILASARQVETVRTVLRQNWALGFLPVTLTEPITSAPTTMVIPATTAVTAEYGNIAQAYRITDGGVLTRMHNAPARCSRWPRLSLWLQQSCKRALDVVVGSVALLLALPLIIGAALFIYLRDPGPVFFTQERRGKFGRPIRIWKLRSMYLDSAARLEKLLAEDAAAAAEWHERHKLTHDPRILPGIGQLIRRYSIDELPQLLSVVMGQLSLVGPRVFVDYDLAVYSPEALALRQSVTPGLTGLWQVTVRNDGENSEKVRYDSAYVKNWTIWSDLEILYRTVGVVLGGRGAY
jgi:lipopolysaccharide/colanic/teichoic acid biosynthesis glycosyltransferase